MVAIPMQAEMLTLQHLRAQLQPGETLLGFTSGKLNNVGSVHNRKEALVGLTQGRLFIQLLKDGQPYRPAFSFSRAVISRLYYSRSNLKIRFDNEDISILCRKNWKKQAQSLVAAGLQLPVEQAAYPQIASGKDSLALVRNLFDLGASVAAQKEMKKATQTNPAIEMDPHAQQLKQYIRDFRLTFQVAGVAFLGWLVYILLLAAIGLATLNVQGLIWDAIIIFGLFTGRVAWRYGAMISAVLISFIQLLWVAGDGFVIQNLWDIVMWVSFSAAVIVALYGQPTRKRAFTALAIYLVGFVGVIVLIWTLAFLGIPV